VHLVADEVVGPGQQHARDDQRDGQEQAADSGEDVEGSAFHCGSPRPILRTGQGRDLPDFTPALTQTYFRTAQLIKNGPRRAVLDIT
jgi:hypothetical protein